ncbi:DNA repair protein RecO [Fusobacterium necrophorum]|uniref:DNA repair protein RecO n=1 Tax=Fusobacterium necrophorum TaxID=859 RepID=UPI000786B35C|nr:DNA repair protein RecO [Fusobacterium necrophorum]KYM43362.1 DNA repair protein RecO [Fusobacterium necrophorum subsp. funduliforme]
MTKFISNKAFVLGNYSFGEADRNLILLTEDFGKIQLTVKGILKSKRRDKVATEPISYVEFLLYKKGEQFIVNDFSLLESFENIRQDLDSLGVAFYLLAVLNKFVFEGYRVPKIFRLLKNSLYYLNQERDRRKQLLLLNYFLFFLMQEEGIFRMDEILEHLSFEEKEISRLLYQKKIESILKEEEYTEEKLFFLIKKMERHIREKLDIDISIEQYMMGGL